MLLIDFQCNFSLTYSMFTHYKFFTMSHLVIEFRFVFGFSFFGWFSLKFTIFFSLLDPSLWLHALKTNSCILTLYFACCVLFCMWFVVFFLFKFLLFAFLSTHSIATLFGQNLWLVWQWMERNLNEWSVNPSRKKEKKHIEKREKKMYKKNKQWKKGNKKDVT